MLKISQICLLVLLAASLLKCATPGGIPSGYLVNPKGLDTATNGHWIYIDKFDNNSIADKSQVSGELIAIQRDTFFVLTYNGVKPVPTKDMREVTLILFKDQSGKYLVATCIGLIPNVIAAFVGSPVAYFGIPFAVVGSITAMIENSASTLIFPKRNKLSDFEKFVRFPQGIPSGVNLSNLSLKTNIP